MSAASTPPPRTPGSSRYYGSPTRVAPRHSLFWPILIFLFGTGSFTVYQVMTLEDQLDSITQTIDKMDPQVRMGLYQKAKFFAVAKDLLRLAPTDANAEKIVETYKLRELQKAQPVLLDLSTPTVTPTFKAGSATNSTAKLPPGTATTNFAPLTPAKN